MKTALLPECEICAYYPDAQYPDAVHFCRYFLKHCPVCEQSPDNPCLKFKQRRPRVSVQELISDSPYGYELSAGTCWAAHLAPLFISFLQGQYYALDSHDKSILADLSAKDRGYWETEEGEDDLLEVLFPMLDTLSPEGVQFGAHPGDGSCFGYWPVSILN